MSTDIRWVGRGRAVLAEPDGALFIGRNYQIHRSDDGGNSWAFQTQMPRGALRRAAEWSRLACRALRHEVRALCRLSDGSLISANKQGVYFARPGQPTMRESRVEIIDWIKPPMMISAGPDDVVVWGEYSTTNRDRPEVRLYASDDRGESFHVAFRFPPGAVRHVHNVFYDVQADHYWVLTGDHGNEPGFGKLSRDFRSFEWLVRGRQDYRAVSVFDFGEYFVYGTDTEGEPNAIVRLNKQNGHSERIAPLAGTCIYGCRFGDTYAVSTTVEISDANPSREATLLVSRDGESWRQVLSARKDRLPQKIFQWGSLILPRGQSPHSRVLVSGQALRNLDGRLLSVDPALP